jgi:hypothetical protein
VLGGRPAAEAGRVVIREVVSSAWAESPAQVAAAVLLTPVAVLVGWVVLVVAIVAGTPAGAS